MNAARIRDLVRQKSVPAQTQRDSLDSHPGDLRAVLLFAAAKEQTWLVADSRMAYVVRDDRRWEEAQIDGRRLSDCHPVQVDKSWSENAGAIYLGDSSKGWLYSKNLFAYDPVENVVGRFLSNT